MKAFTLSQHDNSVCQLLALLFLSRMMNSWTRQRTYHPVCVVNYWVGLLVIDTNLAGIALRLSHMHQSHHISFQFCATQFHYL